MKGTLFVTIKQFKNPMQTNNSIRSLWRGCISRKLYGRLIFTPYNYDSGIETHHKIIKKEMNFTYELRDFNFFSNEMNFVMEKELHLNLNLNQLKKFRYANSDTDTKLRNFLESRTILIKQQVKSDEWLWVSLSHLILSLSLILILSLSLILISVIWKQTRRWKPLMILIRLLFVFNRILEKKSFKWKITEHFVEHKIPELRNRGRFYAFSSLQTAWLWT